MGHNRDKILSMMLNVATFQVITNYKLNKIEWGFFRFLFDFYIKIKVIFFINLVTPASIFYTHAIHGTSIFQKHQLSKMKGTEKKFVYRQNFTYQLKILGNKKS